MAMQRVGAARAAIRLLPCALLLAAAARAGTFTLAPDQDMVGADESVVASRADTLPDIARAHDVGFDEIVAANPGIDPWVPRDGAHVRLPLAHLLPDAPHEGIVVNLPEERLYYYRTDAQGRAVVETHPISVGRMDWKTPLGLTRVVRKEKDPTWYPPQSVRETHLREDGDTLPGAVPPGPDNPLGAYAMRLGVPGGAYLIHGTNKPVGVGMQVTHGCIRLFPEDIEFMFREVPVGTPVRIVNQRVKAGWDRGVLYVEVHHPLAGDDPQAAADETQLTRAIVAATARQHAKIDWAAAEGAFARADGIPVAVSR